MELGRVSGLLAYKLGSDLFVFVSVFIFLFLFFFFNEFSRMMFLTVTAD